MIPREIGSSCYRSQAPATVGDVESMVRIVLLLQGFDTKRIFPIETLQTLCQIRLAYLRRCNGYQYSVKYNSHITRVVTQHQDINHGARGLMPESV